MTLTARWAAAALLLLSTAACSGGSSTTPTTSAATTSAVAPSESPSPSDSGLAEAQAESLVDKAFLPKEATGGLDLLVSREPSTTNAGWWVQCGTFLSADVDLRAAKAADWTDDQGAAVGQYVLAYSTPAAAAAAMAEMKKSYACPTFVSNGATYTKVVEQKLPAIPGTDASLAWCQEAAHGDGPFHECWGIVSRKNLVSAIWTTDSAADPTANKIRSGVLVGLAATTLKQAQP